MKMTIERVDNGLIMKMREDCNSDALHFVFEICEDDEATKIKSYEELFATIKEAFGDYDMCVRVHSEYFEVPCDQSAPIE
jgi:hypothetical protein